MSSDLAFIQAWNHLVDGKVGYSPEWQRAEGEDLMKDYRARELMDLSVKMGRIKRMPYELMLKTLDHFEIGIDGMASLFFSR
ncbi:MAG TPA: hypothetical protein PKN87_08640 [Syntrophomonadaceae bacterium]|nr:hypothetical protein [Syntrophomonadaceae bacterium]HPR93806.1 hypothetical protein [Syntrophomonadaceae bacterium]